MSKTVKKEPQAENAAQETTKEAVEQETGKDKTAQKQTEDKGFETVMYLGPEIGGVVEYGKIFSNGFPEGLKRKMKEMPVIKNLFVPVDQLAEAMVYLKDEKSALYACYERVVKDIQKEKEDDA